MSAHSEVGDEVGGDARLDRLFREERLPLLRLAFLLVGSREAAEDLVQDAFIAVSSRLALIDNPVAYLRATIINGSRRVYRQRERDRQHEHEPDDLIVDASWSADAIAVRWVLASLPPDQREAIVLRYFADLSYREIGELIQCPTKTVATRVRRGIERVRAALEERG